MQPVAKQMFVDFTVGQKKFPARVGEKDLLFAGHFRELPVYSAYAYLFATTWQNAYDFYDCLRLSVSYGVGQSGDTEHYFLVRIEVKVIGPGQHNNFLGFEAVELVVINAPKHILYSVPSAAHVYEAGRLHIFRP